MSCVENGDCSDDSICIGEQCVFFGECLLDVHCIGDRTCEDHFCVGERGETSPAPRCDINADCPDKHYCVNKECARGTECLTHAHCPPANACVREVCFSAVEILAQ